MKYLSFLLITVVVFSSCNIIDQKRIKGNGKIITKTYNLKNFSRVDIGSSMDIYIIQGDKHAVKIETDENLFQYLEVRVEDGNKLEVENANNININPTGEVKVYVTAPVLDDVQISGAAQIKTRGKFTQDKKIKFDLSGASSGNISLKAPVIELESTGASTLTADGECRDIKANASGAATINSYDLKSENAVADASGASTVRVFSSITLKADASGASSIKYKGNPTVASQANGASLISKAD